MAIIGTGEFNIAPPSPPYPGDVFVGDGVVTVTGDDGGFDEIVRYFGVGVDGYGPGELTLTGAGVQIEVSAEEERFNGAVRVGTDGSSGRLTIAAGAGVRSVNTGVYDPTVGYAPGSAYNVNIGIRGGNGAVTVTGAGSFLGAYGTDTRITVGRTDGAALTTGLLTVAAGGTVATSDMEIGRGPMATGEVRVQGAGSTLTLVSGFDPEVFSGGQDFTTYGSSLRIGRNDADGSLLISSGGRVTVANVDGESDNSNVAVGHTGQGVGRLTVSGAGSTLDVTQNGPTGDDAPFGASITIGRGAQGLAYITNGGVVNVTGDDAFVGLGSTGTDPDAPAKENLLRIESGGVLNIDSGLFNGGGLSIAHNAAGDGRVVVTGAGSEINIRSDAGEEANFAAALQVGRRGDGRLDVADGAKVVIDGGGDLFPFFAVGVGEEDGSVDASGYALVTGADSSITLSGTNVSENASSGFISVGRRANADGILRITEGAEVTNTGANASAEIAGNEGARGSVFVAGAGSLFDAGTLLAIASDFVTELGELSLEIGGTGLLDVSGGARAIADEFVVGASGTLSVAGELVGDVRSAGAFFVGGANAIARAAITGDLRQAAGSIEIEFGAAEVDLLAVAGDAEVSADVFDFDFAALGPVSSGDEFVFLQAGGAIVTTGAFNLAGVPEGVEAEIVERAAAGGEELALRILSVAGETTAGDDTISGGTEDDALSGGGGNDRLIGGGGGDTLRGGGGLDTLLGGAGEDVLRGGGGDDSLVGGGGADRLLGQGGDDTLKGGGGADFLKGGGGADRIIGGGGDDTIEGNKGTDTMIGGGGADLFRFTPGDGADVVQRFQQGRDLIEFKRGVAGFDDLRIEQQGDDVLVSYTRGSILFENQNAGAFTEDDFLF